MTIVIPKRPLRILGYFILFTLLVAASFAVYFRTSYRDRVLPNVYFYGENVSGMAKDNLGKTISEKESILKNSVILKYEDKQIQIGNLSELGFSWDKEKTAGYILGIGRNDNWLNNFYNQILSLFYKVDVSFAYDIDENKTEQYLAELATTIDREPVDGKLEVKDGKAVVFNLSSNGKKLLVKKCLTDIKEALVKNRSEILLTVKEIEAKSSSDIRKMGIEEVIATGESNFSRSPLNRIHNVTQGAKIFNGVLIAPNETFSFNKALGEVSAKTGFLPEIVIKEDKNIPEYGGGLCQVSTTFFRAAIIAGFPIIERAAHAYRITYYDPAGMDATIYDPSPDLRFLNDSKYYILVQTRIEGSNLFVDFYSTPDGRKVEVGKPVIYNLVQPGEPIKIETDKLKPGEEKQIDSAHIGADAYFTRKIIYADGRIKEDRFSSHYVPWRAKFEVGVLPKDEQGNVE